MKQKLYYLTFINFDSYLYASTVRKSSEKVCIVFKKSLNLWHKFFFPKKYFGWPKRCADTILEVFFYYILCNVLHKFTHQIGFPQQNVREKMCNNCTFRQIKDLVKVYKIQILLSVYKLTIIATHVYCIISYNKRKLAFFHNRLIIWAPYFV